MIADEEMAERAARAWNAWVTDKDDHRCTAEYAADFAASEVELATAPLRAEVERLTLEGKKLRGDLAFANAAERHARSLLHQHAPSAAPHWTSGVDAPGDVEDSYVMRVLTGWHQIACRRDGAIPVTVERCGIEAMMRSVLEVAAKAAQPARSETKNQAGPEGERGGGGAMSMKKKPASEPKLPPRDEANEVLHTLRVRVVRAQRMWAAACGDCVTPAEMYAHGRAESAMVTATLIQQMISERVNAWAVAS